MSRGPSGGVSCVLSALGQWTQMARGRARASDSLCVRFEERIVIFDRGRKEFGQNKDRKNLFSFPTSQLPGPCCQEYNQCLWVLFLGFFFLNPITSFIQLPHPSSLTVVSLFSVSVSLFLLILCWHNRGKGGVGLKEGEGG